MADNWIDNALDEARVDRRSQRGRHIAPWAKRHAPTLMAAVALLVLGSVATVPMARMVDQRSVAVAQPTTATSTTATSTTATSTTATSTTATSTTATPTTGTPTAGSADSLLIELAGRCSDQPLRANQFRFLEHRMDTGSVGYDFVYQVWVPRDERDEWMLRTHLGVGDPDPAEEFRAPYGAFAYSGSGRWGIPTLDLSAELPREPGALYEWLTDSPPGTELSRVPYWMDVISSLPVPAELRAALLRALTNYPSVEIRHSHTPDGRPAIAIGLYDGDQRTDLLVDPDNCQILGQQRVGSHGERFSGAMTIRTAVVDAIGQRP